MRMEIQPYYWNDPLKSKFEISVKSVIEVGDQYYVEIGEPVTKPTGGGQAGDRGTINIQGKVCPFIDTIIHEGKSVLVTKTPPVEKSRGTLNIDMDWRGDMMSNHTSEHIFVGSLKKRYPEVKLGRIWVDGIHGTIVLEGGNLSEETILEVESEVTQLIHEKIPVTSEVVDADKVDASVRARESVTLKHEQVRLVKVGNFDISACSGLHVTNTSEIGAFKIIDIKIQESETYIEFISGRKAIETMSDVYNEVLLRKYEYPFEMSQLGAIIDKSKAVQNAYDQLVEKILQLFKRGTQKQKIGDIEFWYEYLPGLDSTVIKHMLKELNLKAPSITLLYTPGKKVNFILWTKGLPENASYYISDIVEKLGGRGGGSDEVYTGGFVEVSDPEELFMRLVSGIQDHLLIK